MRTAVELVRLLSEQGLINLSPASIRDHLILKGFSEDRADLVANYLAGNKIVDLAGQYDLSPAGLRKRLITTKNKMKD